MTEGRAVAIRGTIGTVAKKLNPHVAQTWRRGGTPLDPESGEYVAGWEPPRESRDRVGLVHTVFSDEAQREVIRAVAVGEQPALTRVDFGARMMERLAGAYPMAVVTESFPELAVVTVFRPREYWEPGRAAEVEAAEHADRERGVLTHFS